MVSVLERATAVVTEAETKNLERLRQHMVDMKKRAEGSKTRRTQIEYESARDAYYDEVDRLKPHPNQ